MHTHSSDVTTGSRQIGEPTLAWDTLIYARLVLVFADARPSFMLHVKRMADYVGLV
jgi:hypothetical protein